MWKQIYFISGLSASDRVMMSLTMGVVILIARIMKRLTKTVFFFFNFEPKRKLQSKN